MEEEGFHGGFSDIQGRPWGELAPPHGEEMVHDCQLSTLPDMSAEIEIYELITTVQFVATILPREHDEEVGDVLGLGQPHGVPRHGTLRACLHGTVGWSVVNHHQ